MMVIHIFVIFTFLNILFSICVGTMKYILKALQVCNTTTVSKVSLLSLISHIIMFVWCKCPEIKKKKTRCMVCKRSKEFKTERKKFCPTKTKPIYRKKITPRQWLGNCNFAITAGQKHTQTFSSVQQWWGSWYLQSIHYWHQKDKITTDHDVSYRRNCVLKLVLLLYRLFLYLFTIVMD